MEKDIAIFGAEVDSLLLLSSLPTQGPKKKNFDIDFIYLSDAEFDAESESVFPISGFHRLGGQSPQLPLKVHPG